MTKESLKKQIILALSFSVNVEGFENNQLILTTPAGTIFGKLISDERMGNNSDMCGVYAALCEQTSKNYIEKNSDVVGNDGYLFLTNVTVKSMSTDTITRIPFMVVFYDQIIGVSIGTLNNNI